MIEINEYVPESLQGLKSICTARNALQSCDVSFDIWDETTTVKVLNHNLIMCRKPHLSRTLSFNKILLSNVTGSDERAEENYFRLMKTSPENISRDDINKINSASLFRDMNNR